MGPGCFEGGNLGGFGFGDKGLLRFPLGERDVVICFLFPQSLATLRELGADPVAVRLAFMSAEFRH